MKMNFRTAITLLDFQLSDHLWGEGVVLNESGFTCFQGESHQDNYTKMTSLKFVSIF